MFFILFLFLPSEKWYFLTIYVNYAIPFAITQNVRRRTKSRHSAKSVTTDGDHVNIRLILMSRRASMDMRIQRYIYFLSVVTLFFGCHKVVGADVLPGNSETSDTSFSFAVQGHVFDEKTGMFYSAAAPQAGGTQQAKDFAIAAFEPNKYKFEPLAPETIIINASTEKLPNPLFDAGIAHISLISGEVIQKHSHPIVVTSNQPSILYFFESLTPPKLVTVVVPDANGLINGGIVGLASSTLDYSFAAVKPHGDTLFGDVGSGIALVVLGTTTIKVPVEDKKVAANAAEKNENKETQPTKDIQSTKEIKMQDKTVMNIVPVDGPGDGTSAYIRALPFDVATDQLKIGNNLAGMGQIVDMHWDSTIGRLYIALQITTGSEPTDGGRALVVGRVHATSSENSEKNVIVKRALVLEKIAPDEAFNDTYDNMIGVIGSHAQVSLHKVRTMITSTGLRCVVVVGGNGDPDSTKRSVYALPIVSNSSRAANNGVLASKNAIPVDEFDSGKMGVPHKFKRRDLKQPALTQDDMFVATDPAVRVGAGDINAGDITDIFIRGDAVFVTVGTPANPDEEPGVFYSQAIFDEFSRIKAWTAWRRVAGTTNQVFGGAFDYNDGNFLFMTNVSGDTVNTVKRTTWHNTTQDGLFDLTKVVAQDFPMTEGGVQGFVDLPADVPGLHDISLLMMTGKNKIVLVESGQVVDEVLHPLQSPFADKCIDFINGTITTTLPLDADNPKVVSIAGGVLDKVGPVTVAEIARDGADGNNGWLFVGGTQGLAVLSHANGDGWNPVQGLGPNFAGLDVGMSFKLIPGYSLVRKLVYDGDFLYVLTDTKLDRIDLTEGNIGCGDALSATLAEHTSLIGPAGSFFDCIISDKFAVIATSRGLLRVGNGKDIGVVATADEAAWTPVPMPEGVKGVRQLLAITKTGIAQDVTRYDGGQIYALNVDRGTNRSDVTRFAVNAVENNPIDNQTIVPFADLYIKSVSSFRMNFGALRTVFTTDGAIYLSGHGIDLQLNPVVSFPRDSILLRFIGVRQVPAQLDFRGSSHITNMTRSFASGSWLISGDFGLRINE